MNKSELINAVALATGESKATTERVLDGITAQVQQTVKAGRSVTLVGFGTFDSAKRAARTGRNPQTGADIKIPARRAPKFKPGKAFKDALN